MEIHSLPRMVVKSLEAILGKSFKIGSVKRLPSRRNEVYKIEGGVPPDHTRMAFVAKFFHTPGIAQETSVLQQAQRHQIPVPTIVGTTTNVLLMNYIDAPNLCDLITIYPATHYAHLLAIWFAQYHSAFARNDEQVLLKGDARIRNFLLNTDQVIGVDFEESHTGAYSYDLAVLCGSILDTTPVFTPEKQHLCQQFLKWYSILRPITSLEQLKSETTELLIDVLQATATRRGQPSELMKNIASLKQGSFTL
jgi:Ser/Thr protein kinase RdoA (MazF antagonist)